MRRKSEDLLHLGHKDSSTSSFGKARILCQRNQTLMKSPGNVKETVYHFSVLDKVKDFLGVITVANKRLQLDAKDLILGIADLHTPEAVSTAESTIASNQLMIPLPASSSDTETEDSSDDSDYDSEDSVTHDDDEDDKTLFTMNLKRSETCKDNSLNESAHKKQSRKKPKIFELS